MEANNAWYVTSRECPVLRSRTAAAYSSSAGCRWMVMPGGITKPGGSSAPCSAQTEGGTSGCRDAATEARSWQQLHSPTPPYSLPPLTLTGGSTMPSRMGQQFSGRSFL